ncbi:uncharacterized protein LOC119770686 isoform X1 [Culex quinquefasciatus]|uniref:uncharacterized protein LOC119770686 isoform X1 n=1 Tax=Culex quinquefasciatus TaxID=7176 RepID=UPI0018E2CE85|nr:uncharacterized protein LOC119770686 isoform X1 [Culex quinquefasciatus]XP_038121947.1 uncharacterized protein LOC119770686 isoform X1 [Culex quinquefasciatus]
MLTLLLEIDFDYVLNYNFQSESLNIPLSGLLSYIEEPNATFSKAKLHGYGKDTVELLIRNTTDVKGMHFAYRQRDWELVEVLIRNGADPGIENRKGKTPVKELSAVDQELFYFWS